ncbi:MAG: response regulator [Acidobacteriota bacterium]
MHRCFAGADETVVEAIAVFLTSGSEDPRRRRALATVRRRFRDHGQGDVAPRRRPRLDPVGRHFDLRRLRDRIDATYFAGEVKADITWGRKLPRVTGRRRRSRGFSIRLGSYHEADHLVRIHRVLDHADTPGYVLEAIIHHELLHAVVPPVERGGRRWIHTAEFRRREREYVHFEAAEAWLHQHVERLAHERDDPGSAGTRGGTRRRSPRDTRGPGPTPRRGDDPEPSTSGSAAILVAEDDAVSRLIAQAQLKAKGYHVDGVADGRAAVQAMEQRAYDLVLMDCQMPELDGYGATREIRRREQGNQRTPIVAFTANTLPGDREKCLEEGMDDYLAKPYSRDELEAVLARWLPGRQPFP